MDIKAWTEQVEAALDSNDQGFLSVLAGLAPSASADRSQQDARHGAALVTELALLRARLQAALGDKEGAANNFPDLSAIEEQPQLQRAWAAAAVDLALRGATPNHWGLGRALTQLADQAAERNDPATALDILERHVHAALDRDAHTVALRGVELAAAVVEPDPDAPRPHRLSRKRLQAARTAINSLRAQVDDHVAPQAELPQASQLLLDQLGADPERDLDRLIAAITRWPDQLQLLQSAAHCWHVLDDDAAGTDLFVRAVAARPDNLDLATALGWHLIRQRDLPLLEALVQRRFLADRDPAVQARGHWLLARGRLDRGATGSARSSIQRMLQLQPHSKPGRHLNAKILRAEGQQDAALDQLDALAQEVAQEVAQDAAQPDPWHWDRMELGSALGRWASVRDSAIALGMPVEAGDQPIDERWSHCRLFLPWADADQAEQEAIRTGPVTARVVALAPPGQRQRYDDVLIFRAEDLNAEHASAAGEPAPLFKALQVISRGNVVARAYAGAHPGDACLRDLGDRLFRLEVALQWWELSEPDDQGHSLHARVGLTPGADLSVVEPILAELEAALKGASPEGKCDMKEVLT